ncbi:ATP-binding protein [Sanyastnella coralliicola]|uniref:ATP-binding protein n=1 Tax=Sanyastnella coralliicola TaxID=3069118 RepID=UPI0027B92C52|nr:ATP-binding protein [Longitalea sp. SCSIO 12813]
MSTLLLILIALLYLGGLFFVAQRAENKKLPKLLHRPGVIYALSLGVYCTAWTFYGSIGRAADHGIDFLTIYIGPILMMPLWWIVTRKVIRIVNYQHIASLADFLAARYGKDQRIGSIVASICLLAITPYIALQIKAISDTIVLSSGSQSLVEGFDAGLITAVFLCLFTILYGARFVGQHQKRKGMVTVVALESVIKLVAFLIAGIVILVSMKPDLTTLCSQSEVIKNFTFEQGTGMGNWIILTVISGFAMILLPRQFQVGVVEVKKEEHLKTAMWMFPLYLLLINILVIPIALLGNSIIADSPSDYYMLSLAAISGNDFLMPLIYLGGFSAATSMIIVSSIALGGMVSTNLVIPAIIQKDAPEDYSKRILNSKRLSILLVFVLAYTYQHYLSERTALVSVGMTSFIGIAQLAPAFIGAIYWRNGTKTGAISGLLVGFITWSALLIIPGLIIDPELATTGEATLFGQWIFDAIGLDRIPGTALISITANALTFVGVSLLTTQSQTEVNQANIFSNIMKIEKSKFDSTGIWATSASFPDLKSLLIQFLGDRRTEEVLDRYARINDIDFSKQDKADPRVISYAERLLTGAIGPASARIMISHVTQNEEISIEEIVDILTESRQVHRLNRKLQQQQDALIKAGDQLKSANRQLQEYAELKNEFLYTVTHELRTPLTAIRSQAEMLAEEEIPEEDQQRFLENIVSDCERLTQLITNVLDLERYESGNFQTDFETIEISKIIDDAVRSMLSLARNRNLEINYWSHTLPKIKGDEGRLIQVLINLISNAIKFSSTDSAAVAIETELHNGYIHIDVCNNGGGIAADERDLIFEKFYQSKHQTRRKKAGSGLGLAICKNIISVHNGTIEVSEHDDYNTCIRVKLPVKNELKTPEKLDYETHFDSG